MRLIWVLAMGCVLAGCGGIVPRNTQRSVSHFDLGPVAQSVPADARPWRLAVASAVTVDTTAMRYRLLYDDPAQVMDYSSSRWVSAPGEVVRRRLELQLFLTPESKGNSCTVHLELQKFEQIFVAPDSSKGLLAVRAELRQRGGRILDQRYFLEEAVAPTADASGGVAALGMAADQLAESLRKWQQAGLVKGGTWAVCQE